MVSRLKRAWSRRPPKRQIIRAVLAVAAVVTLIRAEVHASNAIKHANQASSEVRNLLVHQTDNRVKNVAVWCGHFVTLEDALVAYVLTIPGATPLPLKPLTPKECTAIEHGTSRSTR